jgi:hypothetical protein
MKKNGRNLILTSGNDPQIPFLIRLHEQLRDPRRGNYKGGFLVISDQLGNRSLGHLEREGIPVHLLPEAKRRILEDLFASDKHALGKTGKPAMIQFGLEQFASSGDQVIYLDPDIWIQGPLTPFFRECTDSVVRFAPQELPMIETPWCRSQIKRYLDREEMEVNTLQEPSEEINTGVIWGERDAFLGLVREWLEFMKSPSMLPFARSDPETDNAWHDQDYFRLYVRLAKRANVGIIQRKGRVVHLCAGGKHRVWYLSSINRFIYKRSFRPPVLVHLAGGNHVLYENVLAYYDALHLLLGEIKMSQNEVRLWIPENEVWSLRMFHKLPVWVKLVRSVSEPLSNWSKQFDAVVVREDSLSKIAKRLSNVEFPAERVIKVSPQMLRFSRKIRSRKPSERTRLILTAVGFFTLGLFFGAWLT